jgi:isopropylmalate/homocitrate/citramalate synthase
MLTKYVYPKCANSFRNWCSTNKKYEKFYFELGEPTPFDVTLRDGLQAVTKDKETEFNSNTKLKIYHNIMFNYKPLNIEVGSIVSEKVLPIFKDSIEIFNFINNFKKQCLKNGDPCEEHNKYLLIPNNKYLKKIINDSNANHFSFITSVSNSFQMKNTKMTLEQSDKDIETMLYELDNNSNRKVSPVVKLYVSCINSCPIEGKIDSDVIINRILKFNNMKIDNICLSDTCGTLLLEDFEYIIDTCKHFGLVPIHKLSLHLHVKTGRENDVESIIHSALDRNIIDFDVSSLDSGGCSVTMDKHNIAQNLSYELYYKSLCNYIMKNT